MKERPILFSAAMVQAILAGRKTQTRRTLHKRPYGVPGDRLWVRETWAHVPSTAYRGSSGVEQTEDPTSPGMCAVYAASWERCKPARWRPSIYMPRWASRLTLEITDVRVERLQSISEADAWAEGIAQFSQDVLASPLAIVSAVAGANPSLTRRGFLAGLAGAGFLGALNADGMPSSATPVGAYAVLWESIHGAGSWAANPWVWCLSFRRVDG